MCCVSKDATGPGSERRKANSGQNFRKYTWRGGTLKHGTIVKAAKDRDDDRTNGPGPAAPVLLWREVEIMGGGGGDIFVPSG